MHIQILQMCGQNQPVFPTFAQAENTAGTDPQTGSTGCFHSAHTQGVLMGSANGTVIIGGSLKIVVIPGETGLFKGTGLLLLQNT